MNINFSVSIDKDEAGAYVAICGMNDAMSLSTSGAATSSNSVVEAIVSSVRQALTVRHTIEERIVNTINKVENA